MQLNKLDYMQLCKLEPNYCEPCDMEMPCKCLCDTCEIRLERLETYKDVI